MLDAPEDMKTVLLAGDGRQLLCLWRPVDIYDPVHRRRLEAPAGAVTLRWPQPCTVRRFEPVRSRIALNTEHTATSSLRLGAEPQLLELT